jgi:hypothetical protein
MLPLPLVPKPTSSVLLQAKVVPATGPLKFMGVPGLVLQ